MVIAGCEHAAVPIDSVERADMTRGVRFADDESATPIAKCGTCRERSVAPGQGGLCIPCADAARVERLAMARAEQ